MTHWKLTLHLLYRLITNEITVYPRLANTCVLSDVVDDSTIRISSNKNNLSSCLLYCQKHKFLFTSIFYFYYFWLRINTLSSIRYQNNYFVLLEILFVTFKGSILIYYCSYSLLSCDYPPILITSNILVRPR